MIISPLDDKDIQSASVNFKLGGRFIRFKSGVITSLDWRGMSLVGPREGYLEPCELMEEIEADFYRLLPREFILAETLQHVRVPHDLQIQIDARSSIARGGLIIHLSAGFVDPGWGGYTAAPLTLECVNFSPVPVLIERGMDIGQFVLQQLDKPAERPYGHPALNNKYAKSTKVEVSRNV